MFDTTIDDKDKDQLPVFNSDWIKTLYGNSPVPQTPAQWIPQTPQVQGSPYALPDTKRGLYNSLIDRGIADKSLTYEELLTLAGEDMDTLAGKLGKYGMNREYLSGMFENPALELYENVTVINENNKTRGQYRRGLYDAIIKTGIADKSLTYEELLTLAGEDMDTLAGKLEKYGIDREYLEQVFTGSDAVIEGIPSDFRTFEAEMKNPERLKELHGQLQAHGMDILFANLQDAFLDTVDESGIGIQSFRQFAKLGEISGKINEYEKKNNPRNFDENYTSTIQPGFNAATYSRTFKAGDPAVRTKVAEYEKGRKPLIDAYNKELKKVKPVLEQLKANVDKAYRESHLEDTGRKSANKNITYVNAQAPAYFTSPKTRQLGIVNDILDKAIKHANAPTEESWSAIWKGMKDTDFMNLLTLGLKEIGENLGLLDIARKQQRGEQLTDVERAALSVYYLHDLIASGKELPNTYLGGTVMLESLGFMAQIAATGGGAFIKLGTKTGEKLTKKGLTKLLRKELSEKAAGRVNAISKWTGNIVGAPAGAFVQSQLMPMQYSDITRRMSGNIERTPEGFFEFKDADPVFKAWRKATFNTTGELFGEYFGTWMTAGARRLGIGLGKKVSKNFFSDIKNATMFNGFVPEMLEEYVTKLWQTAFVGDQEWKYFFNADEFVQMAIGIGGMSAFMGLGNSAVMANNRRRYNESRGRFYENIRDVNRNLERNLLRQNMAGNASLFEPVLDEATGELKSPFIGLIENPDISFQDKLKAISQLNLTKEQAGIITDYVYQKYVADVTESALGEMTKGELSAMVNRETGEIVTGAVKDRRVTVLSQNGGMSIVRYEDGSIETVPAARVEVGKTIPVDQLADKTVKIVNRTADAANDLVDEEERNEIRHGEEMVIDGKKWKVRRFDEKKVQLVDDSGGIKNMSREDFLAVRNSQREAAAKSQQDGFHGTGDGGLETNASWETEDGAENVIEFFSQDERFWDYKWRINRTEDGRFSVVGVPPETPNPVAGDTHGKWYQTVRGYETDMRWATKEEAEAAAGLPFDGTRWEVIPTGDGQFSLIGVPEGQGTSGTAAGQRTSGTLETPPTPEQQHEAEKQAFMDSLPKNKKGEIDKKAMTSEQGLQYIEYKRGRDAAMESARQQIQKNKEKIKSLQEKAQKADMLEADEIQDQIDALEKQNGIYEAYAGQQTVGETNETVETNGTDETVEINEAEGQQIPLTGQEASQLTELMEQNAVEAPQLELTPENWYAEFGEDGTVETPLGKVKMGENQYLKMQAKDRGAQFGMVKPTLTDPDIVIEQESERDSAERNSIYLFIKTFTVNGEKVRHFESVTVSQDKKEVVVSNHIIRPQQLLNKLTAGRVIYKSTALDASGQTSAEYAPQTESGAPSDDKSTAKKTNEQKKPENSSNPNENTKPAEEDGREKTDSRTETRETGRDKTAESELSVRMREIQDTENQVKELDRQIKKLIQAKEDIQARGDALLARTVQSGIEEGKARETVMETEEGKALYSEYSQIGKELDGLEEKRDSLSSKLKQDTWNLHSDIAGDRSMAKEFLESELPSKAPARGKDIRLYHSNPIFAGDGGVVNIRPVPQKVKSADTKKVLFDAALEEGAETHGELKGIFHDAENGVDVATDGFVVVAVPAQNEETWIEGRSGKKITGKFPDWRSVFSADPVRVAVENMQSVADKLAGAVRAARFVSNDIFARIEVNGETYFFNVQYLSKAVNAMLSTGSGSLVFEFDGDPVRPAVIRDSKNTDKIAAVMPVNPSSLKGTDSLIVPVELNGKSPGQQLKNSNEQKRYRLREGKNADGSLYFQIYDNTAGKPASERKYKNKKIAEQETAYLNRQEAVKGLDIETLRRLPEWKGTEGRGREALAALAEIDFQNPESARRGAGRIVDIVSAKPVPGSQTEQVLKVKSSLIGSTDYYTPEYLEKFIHYSTRDFSEITGRENKDSADSSPFGVTRRLPNRKTEKTEKEETASESPSSEAQKFITENATLHGTVGGYKIAGQEKVKSSARDFRAAGTEDATDKNGFETIGTQSPYSNPGIKRHIKDRLPDGRMVYHTVLPGIDKNRNGASGFIAYSIAVNPESLRLPDEKIFKILDDLLDEAAKENTSKEGKFVSINSIRVPDRKETATANGTAKESKPDGELQKKIEAIEEKRKKDLSQLDDASGYLRKRDADRKETVKIFGGMVDIIKDNNKRLGKEVADYTEKELDDLIFNILAGKYGLKKTLLFLNGETDGAGYMKYVSTGRFDDIMPKVRSEYYILEDSINAKYDAQIAKLKQEAGSPRFQAVQDSDLESVNRQFNEGLQQQIDGTLPKGHTYKLGNAGSILQSASIPGLPIELQASRLNDKSMQENHPFDLSEVKDLPKAIQNPLAVFRSATHIGSFVIMTEIEHKWKNYVVALEANRKQGKIEVNSIRSIHYRNSNAHIANWIDEGLLEYSNKQKMAEWFSKQQYNSADVRNLFNRAAKIIQNFENPKISSEKSDTSESPRSQKSQQAFTPMGKKAWENLIAWLKRTGLAKDVIIDEEAMREYLEKHFGEEGAERFMKLWHGSPHSFGKFSTAFIGSGEGHQAYGWGLYFTDRKGIAEAYARSNEPEWSTENRAVNEIAKEALDYSEGEKEDAITYLSSLLQSEWADKKRIRKAIKAVETGRELKTSGQNIYDVKIHGDKTVGELNFMRWDKPLSDKNKTSIFNQVRKERTDLGETGTAAFWRGEGKFFESGDEAYQQLSQILGSNRAASEFLLRSGVDGIQYPTEYRSKGQHEDSFNYVVFDENAIRIQEKIRLMSTSQGEVYGFVTDDGVIYLDPNKMNANTPIHEFGHLWNTYIRKYNKPLWEKGRQLAKQSGYWKQIAENPEAYGLKKNATENDIADEVLARLYGDRGESVIKEKGLKEKLRAWLKEVWEWLGSRFGIRDMTAEQIQNLTLDRFVNGAVADLLSGQAVPGSPFGVTKQLPGKKKAVDKNAPARQSDYDFDVSGITETNARENALGISKKNSTFAENIINEKGDIDYGELERTAGAIEAGRAALDRLSLGEERGRTKGDRRNVEASLILGSADLLGRAEKTSGEDTQKRGGSQSAQDEDDARKRQEQLLEKWARETGIFEEWEDATSKRKLFDSTGTESKVYEGSTPDTVIKITFPYQFSNTPLEFLDNRISLHNHLFPETAYKLIGITKKGKTIGFILEQPYIDSEKNQNMDFSNPELVEKYKAELKKRGLQMSENDHTTVFNDDYVIDDLHEDNIFISEADNFYFIDTVPSLNTAEDGFGGTREYGSGKVVPLSDSVESDETVRFHAEQESGPEDRSKPPKPESVAGSYEYLKAMSSWNATRTDLTNERLGAIARDGELSELQKIKKSLAEQKTAFKESAKAVTDFAKLLLGNRSLGEIQRTDINRILTQIKNASTKTDILDSLNAIQDIVLDRQIKTSEAVLDKYRKMKLAGKSQAGASIAKTVDDDARVIIETAKKYMDSGLSDIKDEIQRLRNIREDETDDFKIRQIDSQLTGLDIAERYVSSVGAAKKSIAGIERDIQEVREKIYDVREKIHKDEKTGKEVRTKYYVLKQNIKAEDLKKSRAEIKDYQSQLREEKGELARALDTTMLDFADIIKLGRLAKKSFDNKIKERKHRVNSDAKKDLATVKANIFGKPKILGITRKILDSLGSPLHSFAYELRKYGRRGINGEGYLFNRFVPAIINAAQTEFDGKAEIFGRMNAKTQELFKKDWKSVMHKVSARDLGATVTVTYGKENIEEIELTVGNGAYIYAVNKMAEGRVKLRAMGITEEDVERITEKLPPKIVQLMDWVQGELLPWTREKYNKKHVDLFGTQMANIENYITLRILGAAIHEDVDVSADEVQLPSTVTGSLISRTRNKKPVDIHTDAMSLIVEHVEDMEHWHAYAEVVQDINTLLSNRTFRNKIEALHPDNFKHLKEAAQVAVEVYKPKETKLSPLSTTAGGAFAASKVAFRLNTALKQVLAFPAFLTEAGDPAFLLRIGKNIANPKGSWDWAVEKLPLFEKRWESGLAGNEKLDMNELFAGSRKGIKAYEQWIKDATAKTAAIGMRPNAFVDAVVCAIGARSVFESKQSKYLEMGFDADTAEAKARIDATIAYNETQQSAEGLFLASIQKDRTALAIGASVFNNQSFSAARKMVIAGRNMGRVIAHRQEMIEFRKQQLVDEGLDAAAAEKYAARAVNRSFYKSFAQLLMHGWGAQLLYSVVGGTWIYSLFGSDDGEKRKKRKEDFWTTALTAPFKGFVGGSSLESFVNGLISGRRVQDVFDSHPLVSDTKDLVKALVTLGKNRDFVGATWELAAYMSTVFPVTAGIDINTASNIIAGLSDLVYTNKDLTWQQVALDFSYIVNAPPSQTKKLSEELKSGNVDAFIKEYGAFKDKYGLAYPLLKEPFYGDYYRDKFSHLRSSFNRFIKQKTDEDKEAKRLKGHSTRQYRDVEQYLQKVYEGKMLKSAVLKDGGAMKPLEDEIKKIKEKIQKTKDKREMDKLNGEILEIRKKQTGLAKKAIPELEKKLREHGIPY